MTTYTELDAAIRADLKNGELLSRMNDYKIYRRGGYRTFGGYILHGALYGRGEIELPDNADVFISVWTEEEEVKEVEHET